MADDTSASILTLVQPKRPKTAAERGRAFRQRQRENAAKALPAKAFEPVRPANMVAANANVTAANAPRTRSGVSILLSIAALALAGVGVTMNGWFARSLGSSDIAGYLFLAIGVAADLAALALPSAAARLWQTRQRGSAMAAWLIWTMTFIFALTAGIGFASINISDVTVARSTRSTPAVTNAQTALADAMTARDRECKGGVGRFCREREAAVTDRRQALDVAYKSIQDAADPQADAAIRLMAWVSFGTLNPTGNDFGMLRLILLVLLPQVGGILLMVGRNARKA